MFDDAGFSARYESECPLCHQAINVGDQVRRVNREYAHFICPSPEQVAQGEKPKHIGKVACDAFGNVMAVMTEHGWEDVSGWPVAEYTVAGNPFPVAREHPVVPLEVKGRAEGDPVTIGELAREWVGLARQALALAERPLPQPAPEEQPARAVPEGRCSICADTKRPCTRCATIANGEEWRGGW